MDFGPERRTTYFIAFKSSVVRVASQYWVNGNTLYYLTTDHIQMTAPLSSVDRTISERLNSEQNVAFFLPAEREKVRVHAVRHTASLVQKKCCCAPR
jgi:hypothetical protein